MAIDAKKAKALLDQVMKSYDEAKSSTKDGILRRDVSSDEVREIVLDIRALCDAGAASELEKDDRKKLTDCIEAIQKELSGRAWSAYGATELAIGRDQLATLKLRIERDVAGDEPEDAEAAFKAMTAEFTKTLETKKDGVLRRDVSSDELRKLMLHLEAMATPEALGELSDGQVKVLNDNVDALIKMLSGTSGLTEGAAELAIGLNHLALLKLRLKDAASADGRVNPEDAYKNFKKTVDEAFASRRDGELWRDVSNSELQGIIHTAQVLDDPKVMKELSKSQVEDVMGKIDKLVKELSGMSVGTKGAAELTIGKDMLQTLKLRLDRALNA